MSQSFPNISLPPPSLPWLPGFSYRIPIYIAELSGNNLTNYTFEIILNTQSLISQGKMRSDCGDIRFTDSDGVTLLPYWIESGTCNTTNTRIWIEITNILANSVKKIYIYYGNASAISLSNLSRIASRLLFNISWEGPISTESSLGGGYTCALLSNGSVACWGANLYGQLGQGYTSSNIPYPVLVIGIDNISILYTGRYFAIGRIFPRDIQRPPRFMDTYFLAPPLYVNITIGDEERR